MTNAQLLATSAVPMRFRNPSSSRGCPRSLAFGDLGGHGWRQDNEAGS
jgi:hypothetical protein